MRDARCEDVPLKIISNHCVIDNCGLPCHGFFLWNLYLEIGPTSMSPTLGPIIGAMMRNLRIRCIETLKSLPHLILIEFLCPC